MLKLVLLILVLTLPSFAGHGVEVIKSTQDELILSFNPVLKGFDKIETSERNICYLPKIDGSIAKGETPGEPYHFVVPISVAVPAKDSYDIEILSSPEFQTVSNLLAPVPFNRESKESSVEYKTSPNYFETENPPIVSSEFLGISSGMNLMKLELVAAFFNSKTQKTSITERIIVKISFDKEKSSTNLKRTDLDFAINSEIAKHWNLNSKNKKNTNQLLDITELSSGNWVKIEIDEEGFYRISQDALKDHGFDPTKDDVNTIKIFGYGGIPMDESVENDQWDKMPEQEIIVNSDGSIIFYANAAQGFKPNERGAENYVNWYSEKNYYMLTWGGREGKRASYSQFDGNIANRPDIYKHHTLFYEEVLNLDPSGSGRQMVGNIITDRKTYEQKLYDLDKSGEITYRIAIAHKSTNEALANIYENGNEIGSIRLTTVFTGNYQYADRPNKYLTAPASNISGDKSRLSFEYLGNGSESPFMDYIEIHYPRPFKAINNELSFFSDYQLEGGTEFNLSGFSGNVFIADVTDPSSPVFLNNFGTNSDPTIRFNADEVHKFYVSGKTKTPKLLSADFGNLRSEPLNTDVIVITDKELLNSATKFKEYREANSDLTVSVVMTEHIYNEFGAGIKDVSSIRNFVKYAYENWDVTPSYVVFWGDAHSDNRNIAINEKVYVPLYHSVDSARTLSSTRTTAHDDFFLRVDGEDELIELISGRVPLHNTNNYSADELGELYVEKINHYENNSNPSSWRTNITLVADDGLTSNDNDGNTHIRASEDLADLDELNNFINNKIYLIEYQTEFTSDGRRKPTANNDILSSMNDEGSLIINWSGHGNPYVWSHENVFNQSESLGKLSNSDKLYFMTAATCSYGQFDSYSGSIAAEELLLMENSGAIGLFAATRLVYAIANGRMNELYFENLLTPNPESGLYPSIGEALYNVKQVLNGSNDEKYLILGDPTLKLLVPDHRVVIDTFPNLDIPDDPDSPIVLKGLSQVKVGGYIENPDGTLASDFNGDLEFSVFDGDRNFEFEELEKYYFFSKYGGILHKSTSKIENGRFEVEFILPKDISFSENFGRMFAFARSEDSSRFAKGNFNDFRVFGIDNNSLVDIEAPQINIYLDSRKFVEGDLVSSNPLLIVDLFDNLGINSTGVGIGHRIEAWVNDSPDAIDMTSSYSTLNGSNKEGTADVLLTNLKPGLNKVRVRAWDLFNNFATAETYFYIPELEGQIIISDIINYPNPFQEETTIQFKHNLEPGFDYSINIYDIEGRLVRSFEGTSDKRQVLSVLWDGNDEQETPIESGSYLIQVNVTSVDGNEKNNAGIISVKVK